MSKIYLVRHGETDSNVERRYCGQRDIPLNLNGVKQANNIAEILKEYSIDKIISSDLKRAFDTAKAINKYHNLEINIDKRLREINFGKFENLKFQQIKDKYPEEAAKIVSQKHFYKFPQGESLASMYDRVVSYFTNFIAGDNNKNILIVAHGGVIAAILTSILSNSLENYWKIEIENATLSTIVNKEGFMYLNKLNYK